MQNVGVEISGDGVGIVGTDGYIGCGLHGGDAIAHSDAGAGQPEHFQVCKIIAKGGDPVYGQAAGGADGRQGIDLVAVDLVILCQFSSPEKQ